MAAEARRIAVVTPYYREPVEMLRQCHESVMAQTWSCDHVMVADGFPLPEITSWPVVHLGSSVAHADIGNSPRVLGALSAFSRGYDAVAFLDADNWYRPDHIERMVALHRRTGADVCTAARSMHRADGSFMFVDDQSDGVTHVDTNCYFLTRACALAVAGWALMPRELAPISDTVYLHSLLRAGLRHRHDPEPTVAYRTSWESDFHRLGEPVPEGAKSAALTDQSVRWIKTLSAADRRGLRRAFGWPPPLAVRLGRRLRRTLFPTGATPQSRPT